MMMVQRSEACYYYYDYYYYHHFYDGVACDVVVDVWVIMLYCPHPLLIDRVPPPYYHYYLVLL